MKKIELTIIIPVFNVEKYLDQCLKNILFDNSLVQYIIVNDGSTDESMEIVNKYLKKYKNIEIINQKNKGLSAARNTGIENALGKWLYFVDSDDYVDKKFIKKILRLLLDNTEYNLISLPIVRLIGNKKKIMQNWSGVLTRDEYIKLLILGKRQFGVWSCIFKNSVIKDHNIYFENNKLFEDQYFVPQYLKYVNKIKHLSGSMTGYYYYRLRDGSITQSKLTFSKINQKLEAEMYRDGTLDELTVNKKIKKLINTNRLTILYRAYINFIKINDVDVAKKLKQQYFENLFNTKHALKWKEIIKTAIMFFPVSIFRRI